MKNSLLLHDICPEESSDIGNKPKWSKVILQQAYSQTQIKWMET